MKKQYPCPYCSKLTSLENDNSWRPFCSERCRLIDLGDWMDEKNKIASEQTDFFDMESDEDTLKH